MASTLAQSPNQAEDIHPCYTCEGMSAWKLDLRVSSRKQLVPIVFFRSTGGPLSVQERQDIFDIFLTEAKTQQEFIAIYNMLEGLESFASHLAAMAKMCLDARPITEKSLMFTIAILGSPTSRAVLNGLLAIVPPSKPLYIVGTEEEAWNIVSCGGGTSSELWNPSLLETQKAVMPMFSETRTSEPI